MLKAFGKEESRLLKEIAAKASAGGELEQSSSSIDTMKIFVLVGEKEYGPYTKSEIFALMREGRVTADTLGRWEQEAEWQPINKILAGGNLGLFSVEDIAKKQEELPEPASFVTELLPRRHEVENVPPSKSRKAYALGLIAVALAIGSGIFLFHVGSKDSTELPDFRRARRCAHCAPREVP